MTFHDVAWAWHGQRLTVAWAATANGSTSAIRQIPQSNDCCPADLPMFFRAAETWAGRLCSDFGLRTCFVLRNARPSIVAAHATQFAAHATIPVSQNAH